MGQSTADSRVARGLAGRSLMVRKSFVRGVSSVVVVLGMAACSPSSSSSSPSSTTDPTNSVTTLPHAECESRCMAKAASCGGSDATSLCTNMCQNGISEDQLACAERMPCETLAQSGGLPSDCSAAATVPPPGPSPTQKAFGDACSCPNGGAFCSGSSGPCQSGLTCFNGTCHGAACEPPKTPCPSGQKCEVLKTATGWCAPE
jgi:hypothetical protein